MSSATREIQIDAAHRVPDHESKCFAIHGHRYRILATVEGDLVKEGSEKGMVVDFGTLKKAMNTAVHIPCDHGMILSIDDPLLMLFLEQQSNLPKGLTGIEACRSRMEKNHIASFDISDSERSGFKLEVVDSPPTAENLARIWFQRIHYSLKHLRKDPEQLTKVEVFETPNCSAVYTKEALELHART